MRGVSCAPFVIPTNRNTSNFHDAFLPHRELDCPAASMPRTGSARPRGSPLLRRSQGTAARHLLIFLTAEDRRPRSSEDMRTPSDQPRGRFVFARSQTEYRRISAGCIHIPGIRASSPARRDFRCEALPSRRHGALCPDAGHGRRADLRRRKNCRSNGGNAKHRSNGVQRYGLAVPSGARGVAAGVCPMPGGDVSRRKR